MEPTTYRARIESGTRTLVLTDDELILISDESTQRATLHDISKVSSTLNGGLEVYTSRGPQIAATLEGFPGNELKLFFQHVKQAVAEAKALRVAHLQPRPPQPDLPQLDLPQPNELDFDEAEPDPEVGRITHTRSSTVELDETMMDQAMMGLGYTGNDHETPSTAIHPTYHRLGQIARWLRVMAVLTLIVGIAGGIGGIAGLQAEAGLQAYIIPATWIIGSSTLALVAYGLAELFNLWATN